MVLPLFDGSSHKMVIDVLLMLDVVGAYGASGKVAHRILTEEDSKLWPT
jgi:hypothetical protein